VEWHCCSSCLCRSSSLLTEPTRVSARSLRVSWESGLWLLSNSRGKTINTLCGSRLDHDFKKCVLYRIITNEVVTSLVQCNKFKYLSANKKVISVQRITSIITITVVYSSRILRLMKEPSINCLVQLWRMKVHTTFSELNQIPTQLHL